MCTQAAALCCLGQELCDGAETMVTLYVMLLFLVIAYHNSGHYLGNNACQLLLGLRWQ